MSELYGRKWRLLISKDGTTCIDVSNLDIHFVIAKTLGDDGNQGEITVYNLSQNSVKKNVAEGSRIMLEAGYINEPYGMIFDGDLIDFQNYKEDGVTRILDLVAKDGDVFLNNTHLSQSYAAGMSTRDLLNTFVGQGDPGISLGDISPELLDSRLPRGKVVHGQPGPVLENLARSQGGRFYINDRKICLIKANDPPNGRIVSLTPDSGLIGSPKQTKDGIEARCLLMANLNLNKLVHIKSEFVEREMKKVGDTKAVADLPGEGIYKIIKVTHTGDTFANDWYTDIVGIPQPGLKPVGLDNYIK